MSNTAIIVGDRGQDGSLLRVSLEKQGFQVLGIARNSISTPEAFSGAAFPEFSLANTEQVKALVKLFQPQEIYYLAAHHVSSEQDGAETSPIEYRTYHQVHVEGLINFLCAIHSSSPQSRIFYAASSLVFSGCHGPIQNEETPFSPSGYYGLTKMQGILLCREFRQRHGVFAAAGILYNHESVLRSNKFLSKKLICSAHKISNGLQQELTVGSLSAETDWGYAPDYVEAFQKILRIESPDDFIIATGESHSVSEFASIVFGLFGLDSKKYLKENASVLNRQLQRKIGDSSKLTKATGWKPMHNFTGMIEALVSDYTRSLDITELNKFVSKI